MEITIVNIFLYLFQMVVFYFYCNNVFNSKYTKKFRFLCTTIGFVLLYFINLIGQVYINGIAIIVVSFLLMFFVYNSSVLNSLLQSILYLALMAASEYLIIPVINIVYNFYGIDFHDNFHGYLIVAIFSKMLHFISLMIMMMFFNKNKQQSLSKKGILLILAIPISNVAILIMLEGISQKVPYNKEMNVIWIVIAGILMLLTFLVFANRSYIIGQAEKLNELEVENQKRKIDDQYFSILQKTNDDMKILAHDFKNHLSQINSLTSIEDIHRYINKIYPEVEFLSATGISKNKTLDLVLSKYSSLCLLKNIKLIIDVKTSNLSQIENVDLVALINNLLDNAVEAAENSENRLIEFRILSENNYYDKLLIINSCDQKPISKNNEIITNKKAREYHGYGLKSVKRIVKKYNADYYWEYDENNKVFLTSVIIPKT